MQFNLHQLLILLTVWKSEKRRSRVIWFIEKWGKFTQVRLIHLFEQHFSFSLRVTYHNENIIFVKFPLIMIDTCPCFFPFGDSLNIGQFAVDIWDFCNTAERKIVILRVLALNTFNVSKIINPCLQSRQTINNEIKKDKL